MDIKQTLAEPTLVVDVLIKLEAVYGARVLHLFFHGHANVERHVPEAEERRGGRLGRADGVRWAEGVKLGYS